MSKLKLNLDELKVESFTTSDKLNKNTGTVKGQVYSYQQSCANMPGYPCAITEALIDTCDDSCGNMTCGVCTVGACCPNSETQCA